MTDYFGYDVLFVMNITDIDDKVRPLCATSKPFFLTIYQIIERARQNHLLETFISQTTSLSTPLLDQVRQSWRNYVRTRVSKGVPENIRASEGNEESAWLRISKLYADSGWKQECLKRDEKFDMHYSAAVSLICEAALDILP